MRAERTSKYLISTAAARGVRRYLRPFARPDKHAAKSPGYRYAVNSLYLESPELLLYAQTVAGDNARFKLRVRTTGARPVARVKYMREAYEARSNEPVRITFDSDLTHVVTTDGNLSLSDGSWVDTPIDGVILEIKFTERLPGSAQELVRVFRLGKTSVPKYVMSIDHMLRRSGAAQMTLARLRHSIGRC